MQSTPKPTHPSTVSGVQPHATREERYGHLLTAKQTAEYLQISRATALRLLKSGQIPGKRVGTVWRSHRLSLEAWALGKTYDPVYPGQRDPKLDAEAAEVVPKQSVAGGAGDRGGAG